MHLLHLRISRSSHTLKPTYRIFKDSTNGTNSLLPPAAQRLHACHVAFGNIGKLGKN
jgi:hypothetical protein